MKIFEKIRLFASKIFGIGQIHYINGPETLPAPLTPAEEAELLLKYTTHREYVKNELITHNLRLVVYIARKFEVNGATIEDLISIDEPLNVDWDGNELLISDILGSEVDEVGKEIELEDERKILNSLVKGLNERERKNMEMRFGLSGYNEYTQKEVADYLGISQSYISRLEKRIIQKLKKQLEKVF